jgi:hypothetical protein
MNQQQPLTEEEYKQLLALGQQNADLGNQADMQMKQAEILRGNASPQMRSARNGIQVAPGWGETLASMAASGVMGHKMNQAQGAQSAQGANSQKQNEMILKALMMQNRPQQQPAGPGFQPPQDPINPYSLGGM